MASTTRWNVTCVKKNQEEEESDGEKEMQSNQETIKEKNEEVGENQDRSSSVSTIEIIDLAESDDQEEEDDEVQSKQEETKNREESDQNQEDDEVESKQETIEEKEEERKPKRRHRHRLSYIIGQQAAKVMETHSLKKKSLKWLEKQQEEVDQAMLRLKKPAQKMHRLWEQRGDVSRIENIFLQPRGRVGVLARKWMGPGLECYITTQRDFLQFPGLTPCQIKGLKRFWSKTKGGECLGRIYRKDGEKFDISFREMKLNEVVYKKE